MRGKCLFLVNTPYQLMIVINLRKTEYANCEADVVITDNISNYRNLADSVRDAGVFENTIVYNIKKVYPDKNGVALARRLFGDNDIFDKSYDVYLFANLDAVDFYDKCGFSREMEYRYSVKNEFCMRKSAGEIFISVNAADKQMKQKYMNMVRRSAANSSLEQLNKFGLQMFYTADMENVYYSTDMDCFIVAEIEENTLLLQSIVSENNVALMDILQRVRREYHKCQLGFVPAMKDMDICTAEKYDGADDYRLFYLGEQLKSIENEKLYFPELSHA